MSLVLAHESTRAWSEEGHSLSVDPEESISHSLLAPEIQEPPTTGIGVQQELDEVRQRCEQLEDLLASQTEKTRAAKTRAAQLELKVYEERAIGDYYIDQYDLCVESVAQLRRDLEVQVKVNKLLKNGVFEPHEGDDATLVLLKEFPSKFEKENPPPSVELKIPSLHDVLASWDLLASEYDSQKPQKQIGANDSRSSSSDGDDDKVNADGGDAYRSSVKRLTV